MKAKYLIIILCFFISCSDKKENTYPISESLNYAQGEVIVGLKDSVSLEEVADYIYSLNNISINDIVSFQYISNLPKDSMQVIIKTLESKSYIWKGNPITPYLNSDSLIQIELWVRNFRFEDIEDWKLLKKRFQLSHIPYYFQLGLLNVEAGKEQEWVNILSESKLFRLVELNTISHIN